MTQAFPRSLDGASSRAMNDGSNPPQRSNPPPGGSAAAWRDLGFHWLTAEVLAARGWTLEELGAMTRAQLLALPGVGLRAVRHCERVLGRPLALVAALGLLGLFVAYTLPFSLALQRTGGVDLAADALRAAKAAVDPGGIGDVLQLAVALGDGLQRLAHQRVGHAAAAGARVHEDVLDPAVRRGGPDEVDVRVNAVGGVVVRGKQN